MASSKRRPASPKCKCCPYGFHIDLDFVKFAENVSNGNVLKSNAERRLSKKLPRYPTNNGSVSLPDGDRKLLSPFDTIFSGSLEDIVYDFEETLNPRDYASDQEGVDRISNYGHGNVSAGYVSDYSSDIKGLKHIPSAQSSSYYRDGIEEFNSKVNSPLRSKYPNGPYSARKPPIAPSTGSPQGYRTALGKTICQIRARQDRRDDDRCVSSKSFIFTPYRKREEMFLQKQPDDRSQYEKGRTSLFGSKTPEISRPTYLISAYQSDTEGPPWNKQPSVQRSSSAATMNGSVAEKKKGFEQDGIAPPATYPEWCRGVVHSKNFYDTPTARGKADSPPLHFNGAPFSPKLSLHSQSPAITQRAVLSEGSYSILTKQESSSTDRFKKLTSIGTSTPPLPPTKPCTECSTLREQLLDLSEKLAAAEKQRLLKILEKKERYETLQSIGTDPEPKFFTDKRVGNERVLTMSIGVSTVPIHYADFAGDALNVEYKSKTTNVTYADRCTYGQLKERSVSPPLKPRCISFGVVTEPYIGDSSSNLKPFLQEARDREQKKQVEVACSTDPLFFKDCACEVRIMASTINECTATEQESYKLISRSVGNVQSITMNEIGTETDDIKNFSTASQTVCTPKQSVGLVTNDIQVKDRGEDPITQPTQDACTSYDIISDPTTLEAGLEDEEDITLNRLRKQFSEVETQTDIELDYTEPRVLSDSEIAESLWLMPSKDTVEAAVGNDDDCAIDVDNDAKKSEANDTKRADKRLVDNNEEDEDVISITEETMSDQEVADINESVEESFVERQEADDVNRRPRALGQQRAAVVRKLLTETKIPLPNSIFSRGTAASSSCRIETRKGDSLQYITDQYKIHNNSTPSTPHTQRGALKEKVILKKEPIAVPSKVPDPIPARIPRPKISRYSPIEAQAQSPDEEAEVADRLTPLRSEMRTLHTFSNGRTIPVSRIITSAIPVQTHDENVYDTPGAEEDTTSSDSEGSYDTNEITSATSPPLFEMSKQLKEALDVLKHNFDDLPVEFAALDWATKFVQHEWLKTAARRTAMTQQVEGFIEALEQYSSKVLSLVVNMTDQNENTALHYAVSHGNFDVVSVILDSRVCKLDKANKAGYTAVMLAALCEINDEMESAVIKRLFQMGNVNAKAAQHGQTALMLAVSHGKLNTTRLLLQCGADLNMQDEEGSTALMCAAEHGHKAIVKLLLAQPGIDASISDCDSSTALSIAVENRHRDIGVLIYAHLNYARNEQCHHDPNAITSVH